MTIDDLERDLQGLARPTEADEDVRLAIRAQLAEQLRPTQRRRFSGRVAFGLAAAAAAAVTAIVLLVGTGGSGGPSLASAAIIRHAITAVSSPPGQILHVKVAGVQNGANIAGEWWQETSPPYANRGMKGELGHLGEAADNGTTTFQYDPGTDTIYERPDQSAPTFTDPISQVRQELERGQAEVSGTVAIDGASLYKIDLPSGLVGYFDKTTFMPRYLDDPQGNGSVVRMRVVTYEYLPITAANKALLSITAQHPHARIDTNPNDAPGGK